MLGKMIEGVAAIQKWTSGLVQNIILYLSLVRCKTKHDKMHICRFPLRM